MQEQSKLEKEILKKLEDDFYISKSDEVLEELKATRTLLINLLTKKAESDILFTRERLFEFGNKSNQFLAHQKTFISTVVDEN